MGHALQRLRVTPCVDLAQQQVRREPQRRGALHAHAHAEGLRGGIGTHDEVCVDQRHRLIGALRQAGRKRFQRQQGQVDANPQHREPP